MKAARDVFVFENSFQLHPMRKQQIVNNNEG